MVKVIKRETKVKNVITPKKPLLQKKVSTTLKKQVEQKTPIPIPKDKKQKKPSYTFAGQKSFREILGKALPPELIPTDKTAKFLGAIFVMVLFIALFKFPYGAFLSTDLNITAQVGVPYPFFEFKLLDPTATPIRIKGLLIDLLIYTLIAYALDVMINFANKISFISGIRKEKGKYPRFYKDMRPKNVAEGLTRKIFKKKTPEVPIKKRFNLLKDRSLKK
ncbi:MAG: hypothetical protein IH845_03760 [Nanoarchaeota archaeon]|nr:hypothetical protein [Nanoarchaeota archaeon]